MKLSTVKQQIRETYKDPHSSVQRAEQFLTQLNCSVVVALEYMGLDDSRIGKDSFAVTVYETEGDDFWTVRTFSYESAVDATVKYHQIIGHEKAKAGRKAA